MIYILSGDIRTGKTTALLNWTKERNDVDGLLCPDDEKGKRYFLNIKSREAFQFEVDNVTEVEKIIEIGPFQFLKSSFDKANTYLLDTNERRDFKYLVIDELGKLELKNLGLHDSAKVLIPQYVANEYWHLILVIRTSLFDEIIEHYNIFKYKIVNRNDLTKNSFT